MAICDRSTILLAACASLVGAAAAHSQTVPAAKHPMRKWVVEYVAGNTTGYSATGAEQAMQDAGLNGRSPSGCFFGMCSSGTFYPETYGGGDIQLLMVGYRVLPALQIRALAAFPGWVGETTGHSESTFSYVTVRTSNQSFGALAALDAGGVLWLFGGVSLDRIRLTHDQAGDVAVALGIRPGAWLGGQLRIPGNRRFFGSLTVMRHVTTAITSEPFTAPDPVTATGHTVPSFSVKANYTMIGVGFGLNF